MARKLYVVNAPLMLNALMKMVLMALAKVKIYSLFIAALINQKIIVFSDDN